MKDSFAEQTVSTEEMFQIIDDYLMIRMPEEIDHHQAGRISREADYHLLHGQAKNVVFDFEQTHFMDSSGIGIVVGRYRKVSCLSGKLYAIHVDRQVRRIMYMSGMEKLLEVLN
ncbi:MAG: anti-sigma factor antagonist [Lachnospiraceae bacterium]|nr:anti-sigma factor antagonist [Lachnospiraceae bacterium]